MINRVVNISNKDVKLSFKFLPETTDFITYSNAEPIIGGNINNETGKFEICTVCYQDAFCFSIGDTIRFSNRGSYKIYGIYTDKNLEPNKSNVFRFVNFKLNG